MRRSCAFCLYPRFWSSAQTRAHQELRRIASSPPENGAFVFRLTLKSCWRQCNRRCFAWETSPRKSLWKLHWICEQMWTRASRLTDANKPGDICMCTYISCLHKHVQQHTCGNRASEQNGGNQLLSALRVKSNSTRSLTVCVCVHVCVSRTCPASISYSRTPYAHQSTESPYGWYAIICEGRKDKTQP